MMCDYDVFKRRRLNVPELYRADSQFRYWKGINPAIAWCVAAIIALIWLDIAFIRGFPIAFVIYCVLMKFCTLPRYRQVEIDSGYDDCHLATSMGLNWVYYPGNGSLARRRRVYP